MSFARRSVIVRVSYKITVLTEQYNNNVINTYKAIYFCNKVFFRFFGSHWQDSPEPIARAFEPYRIVVER
jgi:hypothetical protein